MFSESVSEEELNAINARQVMGRVGTPEEVANMAIWLSSEKSSFCTGGLYLVDGGELIGK